MKLTKERRESIAKSHNVIDLMNKVTKRLKSNTMNSDKADLASIAKKFSKEMVERKNASLKTENK